MRFSEEVTQSRKSNKVADTFDNSRNHGMNRKQYVNVRSQKSAKSRRSSQNSEFVASASRTTPYDVVQNYTKRTVSSIDSRKSKHDERGKRNADISQNSLNKSLKSLRSKSSAFKGSQKSRQLYKKQTVSSVNKQIHRNRSSDAQSSFS